MGRNSSRGLREEIWNTQSLIETTSCKSPPPVIDHFVVHSNTASKTLL